MKAVTLRAALEKIERSTRGYYYLSNEGIIHAYAAAALKLPLNEDERRIIEADQGRAS